MHDVSCPVRVINGVPVVVAPEEIHIATAYGLRAALASAASGSAATGPAATGPAASGPAASGSATVVVDMTGTRSCDAVGLQVLVRAHKRALATGGEVRLVISSPDVLQLFVITGIDRVISHFASLDDALAHLPADASQPPRPSDAA